MVFSSAERVVYKVKHITEVFGGQARWTTGDLFQHGCLGSFFSRGKIHIIILFFRSYDPLKIWVF